MGLSATPSLPVRRLRLAGLILSGTSLALAACGAACAFLPLLRHRTPLEIAMEGNPVQGDTLTICLCSLAVFAMLFELYFHLEAWAGQGLFGKLGLRAISLFVVLWAPLLLLLFGGTDDLAEFWWLPLRLMLACYGFSLLALPLSINAFNGLCWNHDLPSAALYPLATVMTVLSSNGHIPYFMSGLLLLASFWYVNAVMREAPAVEPVHPGGIGGAHAA